MPADATPNHCPKHDRRYGKLEQCPECRAAATGAVKASSPKADTTKIRVSAAEARLRELACWEQCKVDMATDGNVAVKWSAESSKWARLAMEQEMRILEIEHDQWLVEQKRQLGGGGN